MANDSEVWPIWFDLGSSRTLSTLEVLHASEHWRQIMQKTAPRLAHYRLCTIILDRISKFALWGDIATKPALALAGDRKSVV